MTLVLQTAVGLAILFGRCCCLLWSCPVYMV